MLKRFILRAYHLTTRVPVLREISLFMLNRYRRSKGKAEFVPFERVVEALPAMSDKPLYDKLAALNTVDAVSTVIADFYDRLGIDVQSVPVMKLLKKARQEIFSGVDAARLCIEGSDLVRFEAAWNLFQNGKGDAARQAFEAMLSDDALLRRAKRNVYLREAYIRSAEIVAREAELSRDFEKALRVYEQIMMVGDRGVIARRLAVLLWRSGRIREAAVWAEKTVWSDHNLAAPSAKDNPDLARVAEILAAAGAAPRRGQH
jgi:hypothetical protein